MNRNNQYPLAMAEEANSKFSIARHFGIFRFGGYEYIICNKDVLPIYRKLGRDVFLQFCKDNPDVRTLKDIKKRLKKWQKK